MLNYCLHQIYFRAGLYRKFSSIHFASVRRIVYVCKGNICRSPYAEAVAKKIGNTTASSYGIEAVSGVNANISAVHAAAHFGVDLLPHRATSMNDFKIYDGDLLVGMEPLHGAALERLVFKTGSKAQVTLLGLWGPSPAACIPDPYGCGDEYFLGCFQKIEMCVHSLIRQCGKPNKCQ